MSEQSAFTEDQIFPNRALVPQGPEPETEQIQGPIIPETYMMGFTRYDPIMGRILYWGSCNNQEFELHKEAGPCLEGRYDGKEYYVHMAGEEPVAVLRPSMSIPNTSFTVDANGYSELTITGIPALTAVSLSGPVGVTGVSTTGNVTLVFSIPGEYEVSFESFPYLEEKRKIYAT